MTWLILGVLLGTILIRLFIIENKIDKLRDRIDLAIACDDVTILDPLDRR